MGENPLKVVSRITLAMFGVGVGIGLVALFTWEWIEALVMTDLGGEERQVVEGYTPLAFILIASLSAPLVAGIVGIFEGLRAATNRNVLIIGVGCLIGATVLMIVAGLFISQAGPGNGEEESPVGAFDLIALAGLSGIGSFLTGLVTSKFGTQ